MSFFARFLPGALKSPEDLTTIQDCNGALAALRDERAALEAERASITKRRQEALEADESDAALRKIDDQFDRSFLSSERLDVLERRILERMPLLRDDARREQLATLEAEMRRIERSLDAAMENAAEIFDQYLTLAGQFDACGFEQVARSVFAVPPMISGGVVCGKEPMEAWRRERERIMDMRARSAANQPLKTQHAALSSVVPLSGPASKPAPRQMPDPAYRPQPSRQPVKVAEIPSYGSSKLVFLRGGVELDGGKIMVAGDEAILPAQQATALCRSGAADVVAYGKLDEAAE